MRRLDFLCTALGWGLLLGVPRGAGAQGVDLAPTGPLRVAVDPANAALATQDPASGEWRGVFIDLTRAVAQRLGVPVAFVECPSFVERDAPAAAGARDLATDSPPPRRRRRAAGRWPSPTWTSTTPSWWGRPPPSAASPTWTGRASASPRRPARRRSGP